MIITIGVSFILLYLLHSASLKIKMWKVNLEATGRVCLSKEAEIWLDEIYLYVSVVLLQDFLLVEKFFS